MTVYLFSGLGADERAFQKLIFPQDWIIKHVEWISVLERESLTEYCLRISKQIDTTQNFCIVGLSFGGIVVTEITKILKPEKAIIISSISSRKELPIIYKLIGLLQIHKIIPAFLLNKVYPFTYWFFGVTSKEEKLLLKQIIHDTSPSFLKWAIDEVFNWKNNYQPKELIHIHWNKG